MAEKFVGLTGFCRVVDDIIYDDNEIQHTTHVRQFPIAVQKEKCKFSQNKVDLPYQQKDTK